MQEQSLSRAPDRREISALLEPFPLRDIQRKSEACVPHIEKAALIGAMARVGNKIVVGADSCPRLLRGNRKIPLSLNLRVESASPSYTASLIGDNIVTPNPYALAIFSELSPTIITVANRDRSHPDLYGTQVFVNEQGSGYDFEFVTQDYGRWRLEMIKTQGKFVKKLSLASPLTPSATDYILKFTHELLQLDRPAKILAKLGEILITREKSHGAAHDHEAIKMIALFYEAIGIKYTPEDLAADRTLLETAKNPIELLRLFFERIDNSHQGSLPKSASELLTIGVEGFGQRPNISAQVSITLRFDNISKSFVPIDTVSLGLSTSSELAFTLKTEDLILRNRDEASNLINIWENTIQGNGKNLAALITANIEFSPGKQV